MSSLPSLTTSFTILTFTPIAFVAHSLYVFHSKQQAIGEESSPGLDLGLKLLLVQCLIPALQLPQAVRGVNDSRPPYVILFVSMYLLPSVALVLYVRSSWLLIQAGKKALPVLAFADLLLVGFFFLCNFAPVP